MTTKKTLFTGLKALHDSIDPENKVQNNCVQFYPYPIFESILYEKETLFFKFVFCFCTKLAHIDWS